MRYLATLICGAAWMAGCGEGPNPPSQTQKPAPVEAKSLPDLKVFAEEIAEAVSKTDPSLLTQALDDAHLFKVASEGLDLKPEEIANTRKGFKNFSKALAHQAAEGGVYRVLRAWQSPLGPRVLLRLTDPMGVNYHIWHLSTDTGAYRIVDIELVLTAEKLTELIRRMLLPSLARRDISPLGEETWERLYVDNLHDVVQINRWVAAGRAQEALDHLNGLPYALKTSQPLMVQRLMASHRLLMSNISDEKPLLTAAEDYALQFPKAANLELIMLKYHLLKKDWVALEKTLKKLDQKIGGDFYLDIFRAEAARVQKQDEKAEGLLRGIIEKDPRLPEPYFQLLEMAMDAKKYARVTELLIAFSRDAKMEYPDLRQQPPFSDYVKSPHFARWQAYQAEKEKP